MELDKDPHDLISFMQAVTSDIQSEYSRIRSRTKEDPGTAGDEGEENWAEILRDWLPQTYHVVTKGRILSKNNQATPQLDILVLKSEYPKKLLNKKHYLSAGVIAAFECKNTLRKGGLEKTLQNSMEVARVLRQDWIRFNKDNPVYTELHRPIIYGLLAHSHDFNKDSKKARELINQLIENSHFSLCESPDELIDLVCISDLALWRVQRSPYQQVSGQINKYRHGPSTCYTSHYKEQWGKNTVYYKSSTPIGSFIASMYKKLSYLDFSLEAMAWYFHETCSMGVSGGKYRLWGDMLSSKSKRHYSPETADHVKFSLETFE